MSAAAKRHFLASSKKSRHFAADDIFVSIAVQVYGSRANVFDALAKRGWAAIAAGDMAEAGHRLNQAWLFSPAQSPIFHGFAVIALARFNDPEFAEELFKIARETAGRAGER